MKKIMAGVAALVLVFFVGTTGAHAASSVQGRNFANTGSVGCGRGGALCQYVDADCDSICDHYATETANLDKTVQSQVSTNTDSGNIRKAVQSQDNDRNYGGHHAEQGHGCHGTGRGTGCRGTCWR